jgi:hypothetical protein
MKRILLLLFALSLFACKKTETNTPISITTDEKIAFTVSIDTTKTNKITSENLPITITLNSKIPPKGITYNVQVLDSTNVQIFSKDSISNATSVTIISENYQIYQKYKTKITVTSISNPLNTLSKQYNVQRDRVFKNYLKTSYELSKTGILNPTIPYVYDYAVFDIDSDGDEDVIISDPNDLTPLSNDAHKIIYRNNKGVYTREELPNNLKVYSGAKSLVGDFNNDGFPDLFSLSAIDPPQGQFRIILSTNYLLINSQNGYKNSISFPNHLGFWNSGCSGDIDNDGDLDILIANFHNLYSKIPSQIMWNDGKGNFTFDASGIGLINNIDRCELIDMNNDGFLDLIENNVPEGSSLLPYQNILRILWGNGKTFSTSNSATITLPSDVNLFDDDKDFMLDISAEDLNGDGINELIIPATYNVNGDWKIYIFSSNDKWKSFKNETTNYFNTGSNLGKGPIFHIKIGQIAGKMTIYSPYVVGKNLSHLNVQYIQDNIGGKFIRK